MGRSRRAKGADRRHRRRGRSDVGSTSSNLVHKADVAKSTPDAPRGSAGSAPSRTSRGLWGRTMVSRRYDLRGATLIFSLVASVGGLGAAVAQPVLALCLVTPAATLIAWRLALSQGPLEGQ